MSEQIKHPKIFEYRFEIFFFTLLLVLFGTLIFPFDIYDKTIEPIIFIINLIAGAQFSRHLKRSFRISVLLIVLGISSTALMFSIDHSGLHSTITSIRLFVYFIFYFMVTIQMINQAWNAKKVNYRVMLGLMSGYICLGLVGVFSFVTIVYFDPNAFSGLDPNFPVGNQLFYFSYIKLLKVGYGDILPISILAQRAQIMIGLIGQFYLVIIMAVMLEKFIRQRDRNEEEII